MLYTKVAKYGATKIFEQKYLEKFKKFKDKLVKKHYCQKVDNIFEVEGAVQTNIMGVIRDYDKKMIGWRRADSTCLDWDTLPCNKIEEIYTNAVTKCIYKFKISYEAYRTIRSKREQVANCTILFKEWSMEGTSYVATLKDHRG